MMPRSYTLMSRLMAGFVLSIFSLSVGAAQVSVSLPALQAQQGTTITIPITVGSLSGQNVFSYQFTVTFDTSIVKIKSASISGTISAGMSVTPNTNVPGRITVAAAGSQALSGSGVLINMSADIVGQGTSGLTFSSFQFNEGIPAASVTGGSISTVTPPAAPSLLSPADGATDVSVNPSISWSSVTGATTYTVQVSTTAGFSTTVIDTGGLTGTSYSASGLLNNTAYFWRVRATNAGGSGPYSAARSFTTIVAAPIAPILLSPADSATNVSVSLALSWGAVSGATSYTVQVSQAADFSTTVVNVAGVTGTSHSASGLSNNTMYFWHVSATNAGGVGPFSVRRIFTTRSNEKPVLVSRVPASVTEVSFNTATTFSVNVSDPDGDPIVYTWKVDGIVEKTGAENFLTKTFAFTSASKVVTAIYQDSVGLKDSTLWQFTITEVEEAGLLTRFDLGQNYPNPFNPSTTIKFGLPKEAPVTLEIYNVLGVKVRTLIAGETMSAAFHTLVWDGKNNGGIAVPSGVYLYRVHADQFQASKKMTLIK